VYQWNPGGHSSRSRWVTRSDAQHVAATGLPDDLEPGFVAASPRALGRLAQPEERVLGVPWISMVGAEEIRPRTVRRLLRFEDGG